MNGLTNEASQLLLDYVYICERRGEMLDLAEFVELWRVADELAREGVTRSGEGDWMLAACPWLRDA